MSFPFHWSILRMYLLILHMSLFFYWGRQVKPKMSTIARTINVEVQFVFWVKIVRALSTLKKFEITNYDVCRMGRCTLNIFQWKENNMKCRKMETTPSLPYNWNFLRHILQLLVLLKCLSVLGVNFIKVVGWWFLKKSIELPQTATPKFSAPKS